MPAMIIGMPSPRGKDCGEAVVIDELEGKGDSQKQDAEADDKRIDARIPVGVGMSFGVMGVVRHCVSLCFRFVLVVAGAKNSSRRLPVEQC
jgi:hypothetical protein